MTNLIIYRDKPLDDEAIKNLDVAVKRFGSLEEKYISEVYLDKDVYGETVEKINQVFSGLSLKIYTSAPQALIESITRPVNSKHIGYHITRLTVHKPFGRGEQFFKAFITDMCKDLADVSEYALIKTCERYRLASGKFFPDTDEFVRNVKNFDFMMREALKEKPQEATKQEKPQPIDRSRKKQMRVKRLIKLSTKPKANWSAWEHKFYNAVAKLNK